MTDTWEPRTATFERHSELPPGEWTAEPDKVQWVDKETGLDCLIVRNEYGALCGYVGVTREHRAFGVDYDKVYDLFDEVSVHGGVTFAGSCQEGGVEAVCHVPYPGRDEDMWWLGFDCAHALDLVPVTEALLARVRGLPARPIHGVTYRNIRYVQSECAQLALQLVNLKST